MGRLLPFLLLGLAGCKPAPGPPPAAPVSPPPASAAPASAVPVNTAPAEDAGEPTLPGVAGPSPALDEALRAAAQASGHPPRTHHLRPDGAPQFVNRLARSVSPYLLQHAHNPVNWHPWGDAAFEKARRLNRPVLLSVGYSTCHWCHVMERESFEDLEIAAFINQHFVAIKVDREARPDVDAVYMNAVHVLAGQGGWPMTVVLTPDREPFFAGTYFPPRAGARGARQGFLEILQALARDWQGDRAGLLSRAKDVSERLAAAAKPRRPGTLPGPQAIERGVRRLARQFDATHGGWGPPPKFPRPAVPALLLRYHRRTGDAEALRQVVHTLRRMAAGGLFDQLGGGFHRYSTDGRWLVPHFEKMLYDQAQLARLYIEAWQASGHADLAAVARRTLDYVARELVDPAGGFHSATDADSPGLDGHAEEGLSFTWTPRELAEVLGAERAALVGDWYGVTPQGNFEGRSILTVWRSLPTVAERHGLDVTALKAALAEADARLLAARAKRPQPLLDDKVITGWNGLMIDAFAFAGQALREPRYVAVAARAADFALSTLRDGEGRLHRAWRKGTVTGAATLDDHAWLIGGLLSLYEATGQARWLDDAVALQAVQDRWYTDPAGGYYATAEDGEALLTREKPEYDGARPAGNSSAALNLLRLEVLTGDRQYGERAEKLLAAFAEPLNAAGHALPGMLAALDFAHDTPREVVLVQTAQDPGEALAAAIGAAFLPNRGVITLAPGVEPPAAWAKGKGAQGGQATVYVCEAGRCERPTGDPKVVQAQLAKAHPLLPDAQPEPITPR
ncbi:MAG: thioredoxin domain-containing protein [Myxococcales bacterium]|nr:thioredoxin domain-containing protein [Myxococcales bacterium]